MKKTWIIIVTYNAMPYIQKCLNSCGEHNIIVVDNASNDQTCAYIEKNYPKVSLFSQHENLGFGQANNIGISYALNQNAETVFLLNQDAYLQFGCLDVLIEVQEKNLNYGIVSPIHLDGKGKRLDLKFYKYLTYINNSDFYSDLILNKPLQDIYKVPFVNAAGWLLSKKILETVGGFDPIFFHYGEDDNYCQRAKYHGFNIGVVPIAFLFHDRENRELVNIQKGSTQYFNRKERLLKVKFGNINLQNYEDLTALIKYRKRSLIKAYFKFEFFRIAYLKKEIKLLNMLKKEIYISRQQNIIPNNNYLSNPRLTLTKKAKTLNI